MSSKEEGDRLLINLADLHSEGDVELQVVTPLLLGANYLECPTSNVKSKEYLAPTVLDKSGGKTRGYYPDYSVWDQGLPLLIVEVKNPEVDCAVGYREASLYARHLNQEYAPGLNPCRSIVSCNGKRLMVGTWDSKPELDVDLADLQLGTPTVESLRDLCSFPVLTEYARVCLTQIRPSKIWYPYNRAGGQALLNAKIPFNSFAADLAPILRRYFTSTQQNNDPEIYEKGYVSTKDVTEYDRVLESLLKERIATRAGAVQDLSPTKTEEPKLSREIERFRGQQTSLEGQLQLVTGGVGTGKSLFARRYKELLQTNDQKKSTHWAFIDFNSAPVSLVGTEGWVCEKFVESFREENPHFDPYDDDNLSKVFSHELQKRRGVYNQLRKVSEQDYRRERAQDLIKWSEDPQTVAMGICQYFLKQKGEVVVAVMDNVDRLSLENQLAAFQLALWFMDQTKVFIVLQLRDETYERFKGQPPLDTFRSGVVFHITPPRFLDVVKRRLELCLDYLTEHADEKLSFELKNGAKISYPKSMLGEFLKGIYLELFETKHNLSRILQGLAGRDVRQALEMFVSILNSGHLSPEAITSQAKGAGEIKVPEYTVLKILMRTEYRFFSQNSGFVSNLFYFDNEWTQPNNFILADILFWLADNRKNKGDIGLEGYFTVRRLSDELQLRGYVTNDVNDACTYLLKQQLIEADHMNLVGVDIDDSVKITASGFIHLRILSERMEYLYGVLATTPMFDGKLAEKIANTIVIENQRDFVYPNQMADAITHFLNYLRAQFTRLSGSYPQFGAKRTGARFIVERMEGALDHYKNPKGGKAKQLNLLDG